MKKVNCSICKKEIEVKSYRLKTTKNFYCFDHKKDGQKISLQIGRGWMKGKHHTEETKRKCSESGKKRIFTKEQWDRMLKGLEKGHGWNKGIKRWWKSSTEFKEGLIPWNKKEHILKVCPKCGGKLETRQDDDPKIIKERIAKQGNKAIAPIVKFYKKLGVLIKIDGNQAIESVEKDVIKVLQN